MSLERNRKDFERALLTLDELAQDMETILVDDMLKPLRTVVNEYNLHFNGNNPKRAMLSLVMNAMEGGTL